jgi:Nif-specific regulatory protein
MKTAQLSVSSTMPAPEGPLDREAAPELLFALTEVGRELAAGGSLERRSTRALRVLQGSLGVGRSVLYLVDAERRALSVLATCGLAAGAVRPRYGLGIAGRVAESGQPVVVPVLRHDAAALSELCDSPRWHDAGWNLVAVPVRSGDATEGVLCAYFGERDPEGYAERLRVLEIVASSISSALLSSPAVSDARPASTTSRDEPTQTQRKDPFEYANMVGASAAMRQIYELTAQVARTNATVLLRGESGTGKELVARAIHHNSARAAMPFVEVNCAALPEPLFESELFGHERGAFTGAHARKKGRFELAEGGTLFLDEIGELSPATQAKLLRVLQFREFERVGGTQTLRTDVRVVAATNADLARAVQDGRFREDLYYRLDIFTITLPPLRDRRSDIPQLAEHFLAKLAARHQQRVSRISSGALDLLMQHDWPGNVRELENVIERAVVVCNGSVMEERDLPEGLRRALPRTTPRTLSDAVEQLEREMIEQALRSERGSVAGAARALGTTERVLRYKTQKLAIDPSRFRD